MACHLLGQGLAACQEVFSAANIPKRTPKHPTQHTMLVPMNVTPKKVTKINADGFGLFRALTFALFCNEEAHRAVRVEVLNFMREIWDDQPRVRLLAAMWYQDRTQKQRNVRPSRVVLTADEYITSVRMTCQRPGVAALSLKLLLSG